VGGGGTYAGAVDGELGRTVRVAGGDRADAPVPFEFVPPQAAVADAGVAARAWEGAGGGAAGGPRAPPPAGVSGVAGAVDWAS
jgi:hypothetical protein